MGIGHSLFGVVADGVAKSGWRCNIPHIPGSATNTPQRRPLIVLQLGQLFVTILLAWQYSISFLMY